MDSPIYDTTRDYTAGLDFSYAQWTADTEITLTNVPWDNDYRDIVKFDSQAALDRYINDQGSTRPRISNVNYAKPLQPIRLNIPFNVAYRYNYLRASLPAAPGFGDIKKTYYYFITDITYVGPKVTQFNLQLDVWQTFGPDVTFGNSYIERGHIGIAHTKNFDNYGRDYLTSPEGLDVGGEYRHVAKRSKKIFDKNTGNGFMDMQVLVCSTVQLEDVPLNGKPSVKTARGDKVQGIPSGAEYYVFRSLTEFETFMRVYAVVPWVTQGIVSITIIPNISRYGYTLRQATGRLNIPLWKIESTTGQGDYRDMFPDWRNSDEILGDIPERYRHLKKFLTYPYLTIEVTTWTGSPIVLKPESWADPNARLHDKIALTPPNQRVVIYPHKYNANPGSTHEQRNNGIHTDFYDDNGDYLDVSTQISNFPQLAIVNNMAISVLASQRNGINQQYAAADWGQQRALASNQTSYDQASSSIDNSVEQGRLARNQDIASTNIMNDQANLRALSSAAGSVANSLTVPTPASAASSAIGIGQAALNRTIDVQGSINQLNQRNATAVGSAGSSIANQNYVRDTNKSLADWAAKGDYQQTIAALNAKVQDIRMTQPSVSGQVGGEAFNVIHDSAEVSVRFKMISPNELSIIGEFWLRYGYSVRRFGIIPKSLMVMTRFTYWKLAEAYLVDTRIPQVFKNSIRGMFEKGVTVWKDPRDIGNIDIADNKPLPNIVLDNNSRTPKPLPIIPAPIAKMKDEDRMYNLAITGLVANDGSIQDGNFSVSKEYIKKLDVNTGVSTPRAVFGEFVALDAAQARQVLSTLGIPVEFLNIDNLAAFSTDLVWSRESANFKLLSQHDEDIKTILGDLGNSEPDPEA